MKRKWIREIQETLPNTFAATVESIDGLDRLYRFYEQGNRSCYAVISKEKARDGYMRCPAVLWKLTPIEVGEDQRNDSDAIRQANKKRRFAFVCPDCGQPVLMPASEEDGYWVDADQFYFQREHQGNHKCAHCGAPLWTALNPNRPPEQSGWVKIGDYGYVFRKHAAKHLEVAANPAVREKLIEMIDHPEYAYRAVGAHRTYPLSTYIKRHYKGRVSGLLCDEIHQYAQNSGQGDAMGELVQAAEKVIGMTATLINGYSSGIFYLLYRIAAPLMQKDGKEFKSISRFNDEYGVVQHIYETKAGEYNSNRKTLKSKKRSRLLPGVSPMVYSRFLMEHAVFLSLMDMGKDLPEYEEIPVPLELPQAVAMEYQRLEHEIRQFIKTNPKAPTRSSRPT